MWTLMYSFRRELASTSNAPIIAIFRIRWNID